MMLNRADECRERADECRRNAGRTTDDVLRGAYLDLAHRWRTMAQQAELLEQKELGFKDAEQVRPLNRKSLSHALGFRGA